MREQKDKNGTKEATNKIRIVKLLNYFKKLMKKKYIKRSKTNYKNRKKK